MKFFYFVVEGNLPFPIDMLRYACCFPADEQASRRIEDLVHEPSAELRTIKLCRNEPLPERKQFEQRWRSFGWRVVSGDFGRES